jgi:hypothetical protein
MNLHSAQSISRQPARTYAAPRRAALAQFDYDYIGGFAAVITFQHAGMTLTPAWRFSMRFFSDEIIAFQ